MNWEVSSFLFKEFKHLNSIFISIKEPKHFNFISYSIKGVPTTKTIPIPTPAPDPPWRTLVVGFFSDFPTISRISPAPFLKGHAARSFPGLAASNAQYALG